MGRESPNVVVLSGPNGSGKSTCAPMLLRDQLRVDEFVNADMLARGLSGFRPSGSALAAGRVMLRRLDELARQRVDFAFETTLASRSLAPWIRGLRDDGFCVHLVHLWLPSAEMAVARVRQRVAAGGHDVPEATIRRRYRRGLHNFFRVYLPLVNTWQMLDNAARSGPLTIAAGTSAPSETIFDDTKWNSIRSEFGSP